MAENMPEELRCGI